jgi:Tfp pilus assembly protein PilF
MVDAHMEALDRRAAVLWQQGLPGEAVKLYEEMAAYRPRHADSHFNVGIAYYAMGEHAPCMQALDRALGLPSGVPHHSMYHQQLAACACKLGEKQNDHIMWDKCIRHLAHSIYADPRNVVAWATAATNYMALGHEQLAIRASDAAARLSPTPDALAALGINYARVGRYGHAIRCFREALEANPNLHRTRVELLHAMSAVADWRGYSDSMQHVRTITQQQLNNNEFTFLQPFDALAHPIPNDMLRYCPKRQSRVPMRSHTRHASTATSSQPRPTHTQTYMHTRTHCGPFSLPLCLLPLPPLTPSPLTRSPSSLSLLPPPSLAGASHAPTPSTRYATRKIPGVPPSHTYLGHLSPHLYTLHAGGYMWGTCQRIGRTGLPLAVLSGQVACTHTNTERYMHTYTYTHTPTHTYVRCMCTCVCVCVCVCMIACPDTHALSLTHTHSITHTHKHTHTHWHTPQLQVRDPAQGGDRPQYIYIYTHTHTHTHIHTYIHTYIRVYVCMHA